MILQPPTQLAHLHKTLDLLHLHFTFKTTTTMEALLSQFTFLSNQALSDKNFDPSTIEELMKLFELEAYKSWASLELEQQKEVEEAEISMKEAEAYLDSVMDSAMEEFRLFEEELERTSKAEYDSLLMEKAATIASKKYIEAAMNSATSTMKMAWKGISSKKVHPS
ncbi:hypothetical protein AAG906_017710 [Vitis piasezkii]